MEIIQINREPKRKPITKLRWMHGRRVAAREPSEAEKWRTTHGDDSIYNENNLVFCFPPFVCTFCGEHCMDTQRDQKPWMRIEAAGSMISRYRWRLPGGPCVTTIFAQTFHAFHVSHANIVIHVQTKAITKAISIAWMANWSDLKWFPFRFFFFPKCTLQSSQHKRQRIHVSFTGARL